MMAGRGAYAVDIAEFDERFEWRYSSITSLMPHGISFTSTDVKR